jgi:lipopolysaccharide transport system ATP-binding protein
VGSLLEVGTGFHPELTGRENITLNGAILGMKRADIDRKFDEIVAFAEIERFLDTPVKHYSSGMYVRLAFAVAAHLEPEILLVDEVLAVGDVAFQKKCLGKMGDVAKQGRTVLFVSHNMAAMSALCSRAILLENGRKTLDDLADKAIERYLATLSETCDVPLEARTDREGDGKLRFIEAWIEDKNGSRVENIRSGQVASIVATYKTFDSRTIENPYLAFALRDSSGNWLTDLWNESAGYTWNSLPAEGRIRCTIPRLPLNEGEYYFSVCCILNGITADLVVDARKFYVERGDFFGTGKIPQARIARFFIDQVWYLEQIGLNGGRRGGNHG